MNNDNEYDPNNIKHVLIVSSIGIAECCFIAIVFYLPVYYLSSELHLTIFLQMVRGVILMLFIGLFLSVTTYKLLDRHLDK